MGWDGYVYGCLPRSGLPMGLEAEGWVPEALKPVWE